MVGVEGFMCVFDLICRQVFDMCRPLAATAAKRRYPHLREVRHQSFRGIVYDLSAFAVKGDNIPVEVLTIGEHRVAALEVEGRFVTTAHRFEE